MQEPQGDPNREEDKPLSTVDERLQTSDFVIDERPPYPWSKPADD